MMPEITKEIMELLRENFLRSDENFRKKYKKKERTVKFQCDRPEGSYYLFSLADNLYEPMDDKTLLAYGSGSGNEIFSGKMNALRSSSALTYNLFGNGDTKIVKPITREDENGNEIWSVGTGTYTVEFEKQFHTLKPSKSKFPANLDAFLYCEETKEAIACEMKMLEWLLNDPGKLRKSYLAPENYIEKANPDKENSPGDVFVGIAKTLIKEKADEDLKEFTCKSETYDAFQMFKHAIACYTACATNEEKREIKKLTLLNCIWTLPNTDELSAGATDAYEERIKDERAQAKEFITLMKPAENLFDDIGIEFNIEFCEFRDLLSCLDKTEKELDYLKRYTFAFTEDDE